MRGISITLTICRASVVFPAPVIPITTTRSVFRRRLSVSVRWESTMTKHSQFTIDT